MSSIRYFPNERDTQLELLEKIQAVGINIVTCGQCGAVILVKRNEEEHHCYNCNFVSDICDFPDLFYEGWINDGE